MTDLDTIIAEAVSRGLCELHLRPCAGPAWQAIGVHRDRQGGPWHVGVDADPVAAVRLALQEMTTDKPEPMDVFS